MYPVAENLSKAFNDTLRSMEKGYTQLLGDDESEFPDGDSAAILRSEKDTAEHKQQLDRRIDVCACITVSEIPNVVYNTEEDGEDDGEEADEESGSACEDLDADSEQRWTHAMIGLLRLGTFLHSLTD